MELIKGSELSEALTCGIIYGAPGAGKTTALPFILPKKRKLIIDIDRSSQVLQSKKVREKVPGLTEAMEYVDILKVGLDLKKWVEAVEWLENGAASKYALVAVDNATELEHQMLTAYGRLGKNDGAPELLHYNRVQFKMIDYVRRFRALGTNVIFTAWEERQEVTFVSGEKYTHTVPRFSGKSLDNICGLCNVVAHIELGKEQRFFRLERTKEIYAKDQIQGRAYCAISELI